MKLKDLHPAALKEIERAMKNDLKKRAGGDRLCEERKFTYEDYHKKAETDQEKHPERGQNHHDRNDRSGSPRRNVDRISDPDVRATQ